MKFPSDRLTIARVIALIFCRDPDELENVPPNASIGQLRDWLASLKQSIQASSKAESTEDRLQGACSVLMSKLSEGALQADGLQNDGPERETIPRNNWAEYRFECPFLTGANDIMHWKDITCSRQDVLHFFPDHYRQFMATDLKEVAGLSRETPVSFVEIGLAWRNSLPISNDSSLDKIRDIIWQQLCNRAFGGSVVQYQSQFTPDGPLWSVKITAFDADELMAHLHAEISRGLVTYSNTWEHMGEISLEEIGSVPPVWFWKGQGAEDYDKRLGIMLDDFVYWWSLTGLPMPPFLDCLFKYEDAPDYSAPDPNQTPVRRVRQGVKTPMIRTAARKLYPTGKPPGVAWKVIIAALEQETGEVFDRTTLARAFKLEFGIPK